MTDKTLTERVADGESFNDNEIIMFFNRIGHGEDRQIVDFLIERGKQAGRDEVQRELRNNNCNVSAGLYKEAKEKIAALEAEKKQLTEAKYVAITDKETKAMLEALRERCKALETDDKKHFEYWKSAVKKNEELEKKIAQWEVGLHCAKCAYTNVKEVGEENARLREALNQIVRECMNFDGHGYDTIDEVARTALEVQNEGKTLEGRT